jgi:hypothetical protein
MHAFLFLLSQVFAHTKEKLHFIQETNAEMERQVHTTAHSSFLPPHTHTAHHVTGQGH